MSSEYRKINRVGVVFWGDSDGIGTQIVETFAELGYATVHFRFDKPIPPNLDLVLSYAPFGSLVPLARQLRELDPSIRPQFVFWLTEPLPNPAVPTWMRKALGSIRSMGERLATKRTKSGEWLIKKRLAWLTTRGHRFRYIGDLHWLTNDGLLTVLAVSSPILQDYLSEQGLSPILAYMGSHPSYGANLKLERDIPVLWIGKIASKRRSKLLEIMRTELKKLGIDLLIIDGVENPYVFGDERTVLFNRTRIVLNLVRTEYDDNSLRFYLSSPNRALIVSEPILRHTPFEPGIHFIEAPVEKLPETIDYYLKHEEACRPIIEKAYDLVTQDLTLRNGVKTILRHLELGNIKGP